MVWASTGVAPVLATIANASANGRYLFMKSNPFLLHRFVIAHFACGACAIHCATHNKVIPRHWMEGSAPRFGPGDFHFFVRKFMPDNNRSSLAERLQCRVCAARSTKV